MHCTYILDNQAAVYTVNNLLVFLYYNPFYWENKVFIVFIVNKIQMILPVPFYNFKRSKFVISDFHVDEM